MNKGELVNAVAAKTNITKKQADEVISAFLSVVTAAVANGEKVTLIGFGSFERRVACRRRHCSEREGRNPKTNELMTIPATKVPTFSSGKQFHVQAWIERLKHLPGFIGMMGIEEPARV